MVFEVEKSFIVDARIVGVGGVSFSPWVGGVFSLLLLRWCVPLLTLWVVLHSSLGGRERGRVLRHPYMHVLSLWRMENTSTQRREGERHPENERKCITIPRGGGEGTNLT